MAIFTLKFLAIAEVFILSPRPFLVLFAQYCHHSFMLSVILLTETVMQLRNQAIIPQLLHGVRNPRW